MAATQVIENKMSLIKDETLPCPKCSLEDSSDHCCFKSITDIVRECNKVVKENDQLVDSQNIVLAKVVRELQELKDEMLKMKDEYQEKIEQLEKSLSEVKECKNVARCDPVHHDHEQLIVSLKKGGHITSDKVFQVMRSVDFRNFHDDYSNINWQINKAKFFERYVNRVHEGARVLYMFSNAYVATCLALIVGSSGIVVTEGDAVGQAQVKKGHKYLLDEGRLVMIDGKWSDFFRKGYNPLAPYDVIISYRHYFTKLVESQLKPEGTAYDPWDDAKLN